MTTPSWLHANVGVRLDTSMSRTPATIDQVFVLRFWREATGCGQELRWRAQVRNVNTRQRQLADDAEAAFALILAQLNSAVSASEA
jgi:hypothetical protein